MRPASSATLLHSNGLGESYTSREDGPTKVVLHTENCTLFPFIRRVL
jgi:hypothetical protein